MTLNGVEWIFVGHFRYLNIKIDRISAEVYDKEKTKESVQAKIEEE